MVTAQALSWLERNQQRLVAALQRVNALLVRAQSEGRPDGTSTESEQDIPALLPGEPLYALDQVCTSFGLSPFERDTLLLCAGVELDSSFGRLEPGLPATAKFVPTFSLAMAALPGAHWSALTPASPLRRWQLIYLADGESLTASPLRIDERVLHYLAGVNYLDQRLQGLVEPLPAGAELPPSLQNLAETAAGFWLESQPGQAWPVISLCGRRDAGKHDLATEICALTGLNLFILKANQIPIQPAE